MNKYTIYCTEEQTKKAYELGAPIKEAAELDEDTTIVYSRPFDERYGYIPTAEQMLSWFREQAIQVVVTDYDWTAFARFIPPKNFKTLCVINGCSSYESALLLTISGVLDYLEKHQETDK